MQKTGRFRHALITPVFESGIAAIPTDTPPNTTPALNAANANVPRRISSPFWNLGLQSAIESWSHRGPEPPAPADILIIGSGVS